MVAKSGANMSKKQIILAFTGLALMLAGGGLLLLSSNYKQSDKVITQAYSQIVFPNNFIRVNDTSAFKTKGLNRLPVHIYTYRARGLKPDIVQQIAAIFTNAGYKVTTSITQIEGYDKNLKLTAVIGQSGSTKTEQVITITAEQS